MEVSAGLRRGLAGPVGPGEAESGILELHQILQSDVVSLEDQTF